MRIGTWNLKQGPNPTSLRGKAIEAFLAGFADLWLLTEVHPSWPGTAVSPPRSDVRSKMRWAGIRTDIPFLPLKSSESKIDEPHPGEEGLCLARLSLSDGKTLLVACSVLPWRGASRTWRGLPEKSQIKQVGCVLEHHAGRIRNARRDGESLLWGGDFNQELETPLWAGTKAGEKRLRELMEEFDLVALTEDAEHLIPNCISIDHMLVSKSAATGAATVHRPLSSEGKDLSDHAAYTAEINL